MNRNLPLSQRFWMKVDKSPSNNCWEWTACKDFGYGVFMVYGKKWRAHRYSWFIHNGEIPEGMLVCHHCDNPGCVNPKHLFVGTQSDNIRDAFSKGRKILPDNRGENSGAAKLTWEQVREMRSLYLAGKRNRSELAEIYRISSGHVSSIILHRSWHDEGYSIEWKPRSR